ncbi:MAG: hypothetical protein P4M14_07480 [Gammaproteobacteria bacterium]|nr:hypothetical protein [Gammaproteobacteria bacterium]
MQTREESKYDESIPEQKQIVITATILPSIAPTVTNDRAQLLKASHFSEHDIYAQAKLDEELALLIIADAELRVKIKWYIARLAEQFPSVALAVSHDRELSSAIKKEAASLDRYKAIQSEAKKPRAVKDIPSHEYIGMPLADALKALETPAEMQITKNSITYLSTHANSRELCVKILSYSPFALHHSGYQLYQLILRFGQSIQHLCAQNPELQQRLEANAAVLRFAADDDIATMVKNFKAAQNTKEDCQTIAEQNEFFAFALLNPAAESIREIYQLAAVLKKHPSAFMKFKVLSNINKVLAFLMLFSKDILKKNLELCLHILNSKHLSESIEGDDLYELLEQYGDSLKGCLIEQSHLFNRLWAYCLLKKIIPSTLKFDPAISASPAIKYYLLGLMLLKSKNKNRGILAADYFYQATVLGHDEAFRELLLLRETLPDNYLVLIARLYQDQTRSFYNPEEANNWYLKALLKNDKEALGPVYTYLLEVAAPPLETHNNYIALSQYDETLPYDSEEKKQLLTMLLTLTLKKEKGRLALSYLKKLDGPTPLTYLVDHDHYDILQNLLSLNALQNFEVLYLLIHSLRHHKDNFSELLINAVPDKLFAALYANIQNEAPSAQIQSILNQRLQKVASAWITFLGNMQNDFALYPTQKCGCFMSSFYHQKEELSHTLASYQSRLRETPHFCLNLSNMLMPLFIEFVNELITGNSQRYLRNFMRFIGQENLPKQIKENELKDLITQKVFTATAPSAVAALRR